MERPADPIPSPTFLVERYWPDVDLATLRVALVRLDAAASAMSVGGTRVVHVGSILMPADQVVFSLIVATDEAVVRAVNERSGLPVDRIARAVTLLRPGTELGDAQGMTERAPAARGKEGP
jgi:hypothetical protein